MRPTARSRTAVALAAVALTGSALVGCGSTTDDATVVSTAPIDEPTTEIDPSTTSSTSEPSTTTTEPVTTTERTPPTTAAPPETTDVCFAVTPDQVAAVLGSAAGGTPVQITTPGDGCRWTAPGIALAAAVVSPDVLPAERGSAEIFPLFGLVPEEYDGAQVSVSTSGDTAVVVAVGFTTGTTVDDDAVSAITDTLQTG